MRPAIAAVTLAAFATIAAGQSPSTRETAVPFGVGETLSYDVTYASYLVAGSAVSRIEARRSTGGATSYSIVAEGRPVPMLANLYNLYYKMDTLLDTTTLLPHRTSLYVEEGVRKRTSSTRFDRTSNRAFFEVQSEEKAEFTFDVPEQVQDGLSALYVLRTMSTRTGDSFSLPVADEGSLYRLNVRIGQEEEVAVPLGTFKALPLNLTIVDPQGQPAASNSAVWISNDSRRLPLKMQADLPIGSFVLLLRTATP
jgi:hypothetical protein